MSRPKLFKKLSKTEEVIHVLLKEFFAFHRQGDYRDTLLPQLAALLHTVSTRPSHQMYAASLLIVYDAGDTNAKLKAWLIDFAHASVISPGARDEGMIFALQNLISLFGSGHMLDVSE